MDRWKVHPSFTTDNRSEKSGVAGEAKPPVFEGKMWCRKEGLRNLFLFNWMSRQDQRKLAQTQETWTGCLTDSTIQRKIINCNRKMEDISEGFALSPRMLHWMRKQKKMCPFYWTTALYLTCIWEPFVKDPFTEAICALQLSFCPRGLFVSPGVCRGSSSGRWAV